MKEWCTKRHLLTIIVGHSVKFQCIHTVCSDPVMMASISAHHFFTLKGNKMLSLNLHKNIPIIMNFSSHCPKMHGIYSLCFKTHYPIFTSHILIIIFNFFNLYIWEWTVSICFSGSQQFYRTCFLGPYVFLQITEWHSFDSWTVFHCV